MSEPEIEFTKEQLQAALLKLMAVPHSPKDPERPRAAAYDASLPPADGGDYYTFTLRSDANRTGIHGVVLRAIDPEHRPAAIRIDLLPGPNFIPAAFADISSSKVLARYYDRGGLVITPPGGKAPPLSVEDIRCRVARIFAAFRGGGPTAAKHFLMLSRATNDPKIRKQLRESSACALASREHVALVGDDDVLGELEDELRKELRKARANAKRIAGEIEEHLG